MGPSGCQGKWDSVDVNVKGLSACQGKGDSVHVRVKGLSACQGKEARCISV